MTYLFIFGPMYCHIERALRHSPSSTMYALREMMIVAVYRNECNHLHWHYAIFTCGNVYLSIPAKIQSDLNKWL